MAESPRSADESDDLSRADECVAAYAIGQDVIRIDTGRRGRIEDIDRVTEESSGDAEILVRWGNPIEYEWVAERDIQRDRDIEDGR
jgi:hypothetical protein